MRIVAGAATDIGRVREGNEDAFLVRDPLFAVADGMGGHRGGEVASGLALETIERLFEHGAGDLDALVQDANRAVFERSITDRSVTGMGTTLTAVLVQDDHVRLGHVGDSRAYLLRGGELRLLTEDHTLVHWMVRAGEITQAEADVHPQRSILTRAIGVDMTVDVDDGEFQAHAGDRLMLCTDGLTGMLTEQRIHEILATVQDPEDAARELVRSANGEGGIDNITVVVLDFVEDQDEGSAEGSEAALQDVDDAQGSGATIQDVDEARGGTRSGPGGGVEEEPAAPPTPVERRGVPRPRSVSPGRSKRGLKRAAVWIGVALAVVVVGLVGTRLYLDSQWYVGVSNGHVAIYRGIPASVAGFDLHHVVVVTTIPADVAESIEFYRDLASGITAEGRSGADAIVQRIRDDLAIYQQGAPSP